MTEDVVLDQLLALEDDPALIEIVCPTTGVIAWPAIRQQVFGLILGDRLYGTAPLVDLTRRPALRQFMVASVRAATHNRLHPPRQSDIVILGTGAGLIPRDGHSFNRYLDHFADCLGDRAWTVEALFKYQWPKLPRANKRLGFAADRLISAAIEARLSVRAIHRRLAGQLVEIAARRGREVVGWEIGDTRRDALIATAALRLAAYPSQARITEALLRRVRPRLALVEDGCYGRMAVFNATARGLGVSVAEFQHGMVTQGHDAYNVAPHLAASDAYRLTQPAWFLAYGQWWSKQFNAPVDEKVVVGNPYRTETLRTWRPGATRSTVLVIGDGVETHGYLSLCQRLVAALPAHLRVVFRPHPIERERASRDVSRSVAIDVEPDLYRSLSAASVVISEASTVLFEAVGLVPRVFVWDTEKSRFYLGRHPFERFTDADELAGMLASDRRGEMSTDVVSEMWADDWRNRFLRFVDLRL